MNGKVGNLFFPSRELRKGDQLSPYLFLICKESYRLSSEWLLQVVILRVGINKHASLITHLFFADDSLIFEDATSGWARALKDNLEIYAHSSGQVINFDKSGVFQL
ncbi:hypothetical protein J1N35_043988 [Gossypium stocksii]|uniref:Reverse transcriptase domain-containing protein n=1 Tax=Gossypium stocksii TaxID=47602 RepID=A0A9D3U8I7_9ROSI|nr:hypothetical protein J1N35_043988 [Gossypium stocksii]